MHAQRTVCTTQLSRSTSSLVSCLVRCLLRHVVSLAVIGLALSFIAHVVVVVFVVAILHRIFLSWCRKPDWDLATTVKRPC